MQIETASVSRGVWRDNFGQNLRSENPCFPEFLLLALLQKLAGDFLFARKFLRGKSCGDLRDFFSDTQNQSSKIAVKISEQLSKENS